MPIERLSLDNSYPKSDQYHATNVAGTVRFIDGDDPSSLDAMQRYMGDAVHRDYLIQSKVNEVILAMNRSLKAEQGASLLDPTLPTDPTPKSYVDDRDRAITTAVAILGERLRVMRAASTFESDWVEVPWKDASRLERINVTMRNQDGSAIENLDMDGITSLSLFIRSDVSSSTITDPEATPSYIYRSATYGQASGVRLDDVWATQPNQLSFLVPYLSEYSSDYPAAFGYTALTQPKRMWVKAVMMSSFPSTSDPGDLPSLDFSSGEVAAIVNEVVRLVSEDESFTLFIPEHPDDGSYSPMVSRRGDGTLRRHSGISASSKTIKLLAPGTATLGKLLVRDVGGDVRELAVSSVGLPTVNRPILQGVDGRLYYGPVESATSLYYDAPINLAAGTAVDSVTSGNINVVKVATIASVPTWATHAVVRAWCGISPSGRGGAAHSRSTVRTMVNGNAVAAVGLFELTNDNGSDDGGSDTVTGASTDTCGGNLNDATVRLDGNKVTYEFRLTKGKWWTLYGGQAEFRLDLVGFVKSNTIVTGINPSIGVFGADAEAIALATAALGVTGAEFPPD